MLCKKIVLKFKNVNKRVQIKINTLYNLHIYIEENEKLHVVAYQWKYIDILNSSNFFLSELEEKKSCIYRVVPASSACIAA